jgi:hypothetical protein
MTDFALKRTVTADADSGVKQDMACSRPVRSSIHEQATEEST